MVLFIECPFAFVTVGRGEDGWLSIRGPLLRGVSPQMDGNCKDDRSTGVGSLTESDAFVGRVRRRLNLGPSIRELQVSSPPTYMGVGYSSNTELEVLNSELDDSVEGDNGPLPVRGNPILVAWWITSQSVNLQPPIDSEEVLNSNKKLNRGLINRKLILCRPSLPF
jgi:hypothetical protein